MGIRVDDNVEPDQDLVVVDVMASCVSTDSDERRILLMQKKMESDRRKASEKLFLQTESVRQDEALCCVCENCGYVFYRQDDSEFFSCPHCQAKHHFEPAEELFVTREENLDLARLEKLTMKEKEASRRKQAGLKPRVTAQDTRVDDAKTQTSLEMGSDEYQAYLEDLQEKDPAKPDDEFHVALEAQNAGETVDGEPLEEESQDGSSDSTHRVERKAQAASAKLEIHDEVMVELKQEAARTKTKQDDIALSKVSEDNPALWDVNVSDTEYADALEDMVHLP